MSYQRKHLKTLTKRILEKRKFIQVVSGPRQVGKSTIARQLVDGLTVPYHFVSTEESGSFDTIWITQQWETARIMLGRSAAGELVLILDEIQKIKNWSEAVKAQWDRDTRQGLNIKVILLGSSRLLLQEGLTESLAGRFEIIFLEHWSYPEMKDAFGFSLDQFIWFGGYPGGASLIPDENRWKEYIRYSIIEATISRDILLLTRVDKPALLRRLFELGCRYSGQVLSYNKMLGQLTDAGNTTTLSHYLDLLTTAGMLSGLEKYSGSMIRQKSSSPKFQVLNTGLISAQQNNTISDVRHEAGFWGRMVESTAGAYLANMTRSEGIGLYYWREGNAEVDFILVHKNKVLAIEVKSGASYKTPGIHEFSSKYHPDKVILVGPSGLAIEEFLSIPLPDLF